MKEHPILLSGEMVRAIQEGRKTQTRRAIKPQPSWPKVACFRPSMDGADAVVNSCGHEVERITCPFGVSGDRLWVREAWQPNGNAYRLKYGAQIHYRADARREWRRPCVKGEDVFATDVVFQGWLTQKCNKWSRSIHMPRWASRITLEITNVRVERVQEIDGQEVLMEGVRDAWPSKVLCPERIDEYNIDRFRRLWNSTNAKRGFSWVSNPWVWVRVFKVTEAEDGP